jgi:hypothetical protein
VFTRQVNPISKYYTADTGLCQIAKNLKGAIFMSASAIQINDRPIMVKEYQGQRVITLKDIDLVHGRVEGTAGRNFRENKVRLIENEDYFFVKFSDIKTDEIRRSEINRAGSYLLTESGYLMLVKSFTDDLAWQVQRELVSCYFRKVPAAFSQSRAKKESITISELEWRNSKLLSIKSYIECMNTIAAILDGALNKKRLSELTGTLSVMQESLSWKLEALTRKIGS